MIIYVMDGLNGITDIIDTFESVIWNIQFFGVSDFELQVPVTPKNKHVLNVLEVNKYLLRDMDISADEYHNVMMIESRELHFDIDKGWILTVRGSGLKKIVGRRIIWIQTNIQGSVEYGIRQVITDNLINSSDNTRNITDFTLDTVQGYTDTFDVQLLGENIAEWLESIGQLYGIGWDVYIKNGKYVFTIKKGTDRTYNQNSVSPVIFSPEYDNLLSSTYTYEVTDYKNAALIGGEGAGINQRTATIGSYSGLDRYEAYIDGGSVSSNGEIITEATYYKMLQDFGKEELANITAYTEKFEGEIVANGMYELNKDYFLGDLVQIENENGISAVSRIIEIIYSEDANGINLIPTFSDWEGVN